MSKNSPSRKRVVFLARAAVIAALYAGLTLALPMLSYGSSGGIELRFAEALTLLPVLTPAAIPGLAAGCVLANLGSPFGLVDIVFGSLASLLAALCAYWLRGVQLKRLPWLSALMPVLWNGVVVGAILACMLFDSFTWANMLVMGGQVALSELLVCCALGLPLVALLRKTKLFQE